MHNNESHDVLLPEARPASAIHRMRQSTRGHDGLPAHDGVSGLKPRQCPRKAQAERMLGPIRDETNIEHGYGLSLGLISPLPPHSQDTRRCHHTCMHRRGVGHPTRKPTGAHPSRQSFGTTRRIRKLVRKPLGLNPYAGKSCPDPGRLSTFGVSGLYPCRRLTYRGACRIHAGIGNPIRQTVVPALVVVQVQFDGLAQRVLNRLS
jgi:hypothetical protein